MGLPQILVIAWLVVATLGGIVRAALPINGMLVMTRRQQRITSLFFAAAAAGEALLLWQGGFWK